MNYSDEDIKHAKYLIKVEGSCMSTKIWCKDCFVYKEIYANSDTTHCSSIEALKLAKLLLKKVDNKLTDILCT